MTQFYNGMPALELGKLAWQKASYSGDGGNGCVETAPTGDGQVAVRNSRHPDGPALILTRAEIKAFLAGVKDGEFDHLVH